MTLSDRSDPSMGKRSQQERTDAFKQHAHLIRPIARQVGAWCPEQLDDLAQVGAIGLLRAIDRCDPEQATNFRHYAAASITGEMRHYLRDLAPLVRAPREIIEMRPRVARGRQVLEQQTGQTARAEAIAEHCNLPVEKVHECLALESRGTPASLDDEREKTRYQLMDNRYTSFELALEDRLLLEGALRRLRGASREVIEFAFYEDLTQTEIAKILGISQMQVSRRLRAAVKELWKILHTRLF
ncbi:MAG: sigma-70 family RNA polymerase sigma factor [Candidatus Sericytochromatia bacterium]|nr:sigma-70 family RNA polymerase sigma factor [Candidatus Sericytochromatia bacterium]